MMDIPFKKHKEYILKACSTKTSIEAYYTVQDECKKC